MPSVINIQPTLIGKNATKIELSLQYTINATDATIIVDLKDNNVSILKTSAVYIPSEVYSTWSSDEPIISYILTQY